MAVDEPKFCVCYLNGDSQGAEEFKQGRPHADRQQS
jgi:hypothetical protein